MVAELDAFVTKFLIPAWMRPATPARTWSKNFTTVPPTHRVPPVTAFDVILIKHDYT